jgi:hypothetical protein
MEFTGIAPVADGSCRMALTARTREVMP